MRRSREIVIQSWGSAGDVFPFLELAKELRLRGHRVTLITNCVFESRAHAIDVRFVPCDTPAEYERFLSYGERLFTDAGLDALFDDYVVPRFLGDVKLLLQHVTRDSLIITNNLTSWAPLVAAERVGAEVITVFLTPSYLADMHLEVAWLQRAASVVNEVRAAIGLPVVTDWQQFLIGAHDHLAAWPVSFAEPDPSWLVLVTPVGFLHNREAESAGGDPAALAFIEAGAPPILITGGSSRFIRPTFYSTAVTACIESRRRGLIAAPDPSLVPAGLPASIAAFPPLPFADIVPRVAAVIHHGGYGVSVRALISGTPQLILAAGSDRPDNGRRLERLGVACMLEEAAWHRSPAALDELVSCSRVRERCAHWAGELALHGGASSASRAADVLESR